MPSTRRRIAVVLALVSVFVVACGTTGTSGSAAPSGGASGSDAICTDAAALRTSLDSLKGLDLTAVGTNGLNDAVSDVKASATALESSAQGAVASERADLQAAIATLQTAVGGLTTDATVREKATELAAAITGVDTAAAALEAALPSC